MSRRRDSRGWEQNKNNAHTGDQRKDTPRGMSKGVICLSSIPLTAVNPSYH